MMIRFVGNGRAMKSKRERLPMHLSSTQISSLDVFLVYASLERFLRALHRCVFEQPAAHRSVFFNTLLEECQDVGGRRSEIDGDRTSINELQRQRVFVLLSGHHDGNARGECHHGKVKIQGLPWNSRAERSVQGQPGEYGNQAIEDPASCLSHANQKICLVKG